MLLQRIDGLQLVEIAATGARVIASANPGCTMQIVAGLRELGVDAEVVTLCNSWIAQNEGWRTNSLRVDAGPLCGRGTREASARVLRGV